MSVHVYVFDDDELIRSTLSYFLKQECFCTANEACADIIITDINMPGMNGLKFVENQVKKGCKVEHVAVMSGDWEDPLLRSAHQLGCQIFYKPFSIHELKQWLDKIRKDILETKSDLQIPVNIIDRNKALEEKRARISKSRAVKSIRKSSP